MPFLAPLGAAGITSLIGAGASVAGSALSGRPKTTTQQSSSTPTFSPELQALMSQLGQYSSASMANPMSTFDAMRGPGLDKINRQYDLMPQQLTTQMARRGYGSSGAMGNTMFQTQLARAGAVNNFEGQLAQMAADRQQQGASLGTSLLNLGRGNQGTGSYTTPDMSLSNGLMSGGNGLSNLSTLLMLRNILQP
jgi:hypothetical protein